MVTTFYPPQHFGGDAMYVYRLTNELARRGHRVTVVHCADAYSILRGRSGGEFHNHPNVTVHTLESRLGAVSPLVTYLSGRPGLKMRALQRVFEEKFDVVHFHNVSLVGGPGVLALRRRRQAVHHARALARLPDARALEERPGAM